MQITSSEALSDASIQTLLIVRLTVHGSCPSREARNLIQELPPNYSAMKNVQRNSQRKIFIHERHLPHFGSQLTKSKALPSHDKKPLRLM